jgi:hypothetical protein
MGVTLTLHIIAGMVGLVSGFTALAVLKGATLHRRAGMAFVIAMLSAALFGIIVAAAGNIALVINIPAAVLTACLVATALLTVREPSPFSRGIIVVTMLLTLAVGVVCLKLGFETVAAGGKGGSIPAFPFFLFGAVGTLAGLGDLRVLKSGPLRGAPRLGRHLWRMCFALFIAALSFFIGQAEVFPKPVRIPALLGLPVLTVLVAMFYWLWRVRPRHAGRLKSHFYETATDRVM